MPVTYGAADAKVEYLGRTWTHAGFHFGTQSSVTRVHLPSLNGSAICPKWLFWVTDGDAGFKLAKTENPRVGVSIPPLATVKSSVYSDHTGNGLYRRPVV